MNGVWDRKDAWGAWEYARDAMKIMDSVWRHKMEQRGVWDSRGATWGKHT